MITLLWAAGSFLLSLGGTYLVLRVLVWLACRFDAATCPACGSKWRTELTGEWAGDEDWDCRACGHQWTVRY